MFTRGRFVTSLTSDLDSVNYLRAHLDVEIKICLKRWKCTDRSLGDFLEHIDEETKKGEFFFKADLSITLREMGGDFTHPWFHWGVWRDLKDYEIKHHFLRSFFLSSHYLDKFFKACACLHQFVMHYHIIIFIFKA